MRVRKIDPTNKKDRNKFINLPFDIYKECPQWVPPIKNQMHFIMDAEKHPFYHHSNADFYIIEDGKQVISRLAVLNHRNYSKFHNHPTGMFYYFDSYDDDQASHLLFNTALDWYRKENIKTVYGPKGFARSDAVGLLVDGFEQYATMGMIYNFPYYQKLIENAGFVKETDHYTGYIERSSEMPEKFHRAADRVLKRNGFTIKSFSNKDEMREWIPQLEEIHHLAFENNIGYYPSTKEEFQLLAENLIAVIEPQIAKLILKGDEIAGFILAYPEISNGLRRCKGNIYPFGWLHLLAEKKRTEWVIGSVIGLMPKYQGVGGNILLYVEMNNTLRSMHFNKAEISQIDERNIDSFNGALELGTTWYKTNRTYRYDL
ncbi:MAG: hypothetical protein JEZ00_00500 [Anaerolineaceae bacterium]|nr:hypothetical protein [Anaerolineaceae bacterium]